MGHVPYGEFFIGTIDEVRIYNRALSQSEIQADMNAAIAAPDTLAPSAPAGLSASAASNSQVNLAWNGSTDNFDVTGYRVERCTGAGCTNFLEVATASDVTGTSPSLGTDRAWLVTAMMMRSARFA